MGTAAQARAQRVARGSFYTPAAVAELVLSLVLGGRDRSRMRLIDPTCGDGGFLALAAARGVPAPSLVGLDIDAGAVEAARARVPGARVGVGDLFDSDLGGGFDAVVGNPPYVRTERIAAADKQRIGRALSALYPDAAGDVAAVVGRGDLAAWSLARSVALLAPGGRLGFVISAALLDADYAAPLWRLLSRRGRLLALVSSPRERWFADAAVHTVIAVFEGGRGGVETPGPVSLCRLDRPIAEASAHVSALADLERVGEIRRVELEAPARLGALLRAPPAWLELEAALGDRLVPLGEIAEVRRGFTTGANDIFYMSRSRAAALGIEPAVLAPVVRAPPRAGLCAVAVDPDAIEDLVLIAPPELAGAPGARRYLEGHAAAAARPTLRSRSPWWRLRRRRARIFLTKAYARRFVQRWSPSPLDCDQRVYAVTPRGLEPPLVAAVLNATVTALAIEALGRASMGEGALEWTVADARALPVLDPRRFDTDQMAAIEGAFASLAARPIGPAADEIDRPDRSLLDRLVAPDLDGLSLRRALAAAVDERCERARL